MSAGLSLDESARRAGAHRWAEGRLFEILGGWVASTPEPAVKLMLDRHSQHHAWRAAQWWDRLPVLADVDRAGLAVPASAGAAAAADRLAGLATTGERLAGLYRCALPRRVAAYRRHRAVADPVGDGSSHRTLDLVLADTLADWQEGEEALQDLLDAGIDPSAVGRAAAAVAAVESLVADRAGLRDGPEHPKGPTGP